VECAAHWANLAFNLFFLYGGSVTATPLCVASLMREEHIKPAFALEHQLAATSTFLGNNRY